MNRPDSSPRPARRGVCRRCRDSIYELETFRLKLTIREPFAGPLNEPAAAANVARAVLAERDADQEHFLLLALDTQNKARAVKVLFSGGQSQSIVDPKLVFRAALLLGAAAVIVAHNHPSGNPAPSADDVAITRRLRDAGQALGLPVLDHIIIAGDAYRSLAANNWGAAI